MNGFSAQERLAPPPPDPNFGLWVGKREPEASRTSCSRWISDSRGDFSGND